MKELINTAIQKYCKSLAKRHGIKDISRVQAIIERTVINYDYGKLGNKMGLWDGSQTAKLLKSSLQILNYFPPLCVDKLRKLDPEKLEILLKDKSVINLLIKLFKFCPSLEEALSYLPNEVGLNLFEKEDLSILSQKENFIKEITKYYVLIHPGGYPPFFTLDELVNILEDFIFQQKQDSEFIIKTGYPRHLFCKHTYLDRLSRCYYIRCPERIEFYNLSISNSYPECWIRYSKSKFWDLISEIPIQMSSAKNVLLKYIWKKGSYEEAPLIEGLSSEKAELLEMSRFIVFEYKLKVLNTILQSLRNKDVSDLWKKCFNIFLESGIQEIFKLFIEMDVFYHFSEEKELEVFINIRDVGFPYRRVERPYISGGARHIFDVIRYFEKEIKIGTFSKTKAILNKLPANISLISYYQAVNQPWQKTLESAFNTFLQLEKEENEFYKEFGERMEYDLSRIVDADIPIKIAHYPMVKKFSDFLESQEKQDIIFQVAMTHAIKTSDKQKIQPAKPLPTPPGINWHDVTIHFISDESVEIRAAKPLGVKNFIEMEFEDRRTHKPNLAWVALNAFAICQGEISWEDKSVDKRTRDTLKSRVKEIRKKLKFSFNIEDEPFEPYRKAKAYKAKFSITIREDIKEDILDKLFVSGKFPASFHKKS